MTPTGSIEVRWEPIPPEQTNFFQIGKKNASELAPKFPDDLRAARLWTFQEGAHYRKVEEQFRAIATDVFETLVTPDQRMVCWLMGTVLRGGLPTFFPCLEELQNEGYKIFEVSKESGPGFVYGYISLEYSRNWLARMISNIEIDLGTEIHIQAMLTDKKNVKALLETPRIRINDTPEIFERAELLIESMDHFEGLQLLAKTDQLSRTLSRLRESLPSRISLRIST